MSAGKRPSAYSSISLYSVSKAFNLTDFSFFWFITSVMLYIVVLTERMHDSMTLNSLILGKDTSLK